MREILNLGLKLLLICAIAAAALGATFSVTKDPIAQQEALADKAANQAVCPDATEFNEIQISGLQSREGWKEAFTGVTQALEAKKDGKTIAYILKVNGTGYGGTIAMTVSVDAQGKFMNMNIGSMNETPGLGTNATKDEFRNQFVGKPTDRTLTVTKNPPVNDTEIQALSGATITTNGVTNAMNLAGAFAQDLLIK